MNKAAIYHRPESEMAYLYKENLVHLRLKSALSDLTKVELIYNDPYLFDGEIWQYLTLEMIKELSTENNDYFTCELTIPTKRLDYVFVLTDNNGRKWIYNEAGIFEFDEKLLSKKYAAFRLPYFHAVDQFSAPEWVKNTVWYQIFPERFANGNPERSPENVKAWNPSESPERQDFYGGDLQGVINHLDHLTELGVNGIYFTPIFKASSNHKYDTEDYLEIDPHFGDKEIFKKLVAEAHKRGIKIMLDAVFNHIGDTSPQWQDVLKHQEKSKYADWFHINQFPATYTKTDDFEFTADATYDTFAFTPHMPKLNTANPEVQAHLLNIAEYWIREFDIDAWRLDVADEVDHAFWKKFRQTCDAAKENVYILGEVWHSAQPWLQFDEFSAVMNYAYMNAIIDHFVKKSLSSNQMISGINNQLMLYRKQTSQVMFNVLDSHDTARILTLANEDKALLKQVEAFTYLQPGSPCIYYGDEFGVTGNMDPDCRKCMPWTAEHQDLELFDFFKKLVKFRKENATIISEGTMKWSNDDVICLKRELNGQKIIGKFNTSEQAVKFDERKIILSNLTENGKILPKGFVIAYD